jgi:hypothetical protein
VKRLMLLGLLLLATLPALAVAEEKAPAADPSPRFEAVEQSSDTMTIVSIDEANRYVTLKSASGDTATIKCGPEVRNFAQLRVKDRVVTKYSEKFTVHVDTTGVAEVTSETVTGRAPLGAKPSASQTETTQAKATIDAIDKNAGTVTLRGLDNEPYTLHPLDPANLDRVKVGQVVVFTHTVAVAISVEKPAAKKAAPPKKK